MDITVYLPNDIGRRAKAADLPLSRMLRDAVTEELERRDAMTKTLEAAETIELDLVDENGNPYTGRITGTTIADDDYVTVYVTDDERVIVYVATRQKHVVLGDPQTELESWLRGDAYIEAMAALGLKPVVDL